MKFLLRILLIVVLIFLSSMLIPWPVVCLAVSAFAVGLIFGKRPRRKRVYGKSKIHRPLSFWSGFIAAALAWGGLAYWLNSQNEGILSSKIFGLLPVDAISPDSGPIFLVFLTALIAGLLGAISSLSGQLLGEMVK